MKYCVQKLRQKCIDILTQKIPTSLTDMDAICGMHAKDTTSTADIHFSIINLARETNVPELLPFVFYLCACLPTNDIHDTAILSWKDKAICLAGRDELLKAQRTISFLPFINFKSSPSCRNHPPCVSKIQDRLGVELLSLVWVKVMTLEICGTKILASHVCIYCVENVVSQHQERCKQVWDMLPGMFQLGSWEDIWKMQNN